MVWVIQGKNDGGMEPELVYIDKYSQLYIDHYSLQLLQVDSITLIPL